MGDLLDLVEFLGLPPLVQLLLVPFAVVGVVASGIKAWETVKHLVRHRLSYRAKYDLLAGIRTGLDRQYIENILGVPGQTMTAMDGSYNISLYAEPEYILKLVFSSSDRLEMYSVTVMDPDFRPCFRVTNTEYRLGEVTYADFSDAQVLYAHCSSKDCRYAESQYLANPGDYQDLLLASHFPPGTSWNTDDSQQGIVSLCHDLRLRHDEYRCVLMRDSLIESVRQNAKPNCFGFAAMGFDDAGAISVGAVYADTRPLLRQYYRQPYDPYRK